MYHAYHNYLSNDSRFGLPWSDGSEEEEEGTVEDLMKTNRGYYTYSLIATICILHEQYM